MTSGTERDLHDPDPGNGHKTDLTSAISDTASSRIVVPPELIPSLHKLNSQDYLDFLKRELAGEESLKDSFVHVVHKPCFEYGMAVVILLNMVVMILETDIMANEADGAKAVTHWTGIFGWVVLGIFILELSLRLFTTQCRFWRDAWNVFDFIIVIVDAAFSVAGLLAGSSFPVSILRIFRLAKLVRAFKVFRIFPELRLLLAGLISSMSAIFWGTVLLIFFLLVWALVAVLTIHPLNKEIDYADCERCPRAYSSVMQATLTFWAQIVTGDSWGQVSIPIIERHPSTAVFFILLYLTVGMAVVNLILGVVVNVAQRSQDALQEEDTAERALQKLERHTRLIRLCKDMDTDNDGKLSKDEVYSAMQMPGEFRESVLALDISDQEFDIVWKIIDTESKGYVSYKELVSKLSTMKSSDATFMIAYIKYYTTTLKETLFKKLDEQTASFSELQRMERRARTERSEIINLERSLNAELSMIRQSEHAVSFLLPTDERLPACGATSSANDCEPMAYSARELQHLDDQSTSHDVRCGAISERAIDIPQNLLQQVRQDIANLQSEIKVMVMNMNTKFSSQATPIGETLRANLQYDMMAVPAKHTHLMSLPTCCGSMASSNRHVFQIPVQQGLANTPRSTPLAPTPTSLKNACEGS